MIRGKRLGLLLPSLGQFYVSGSAFFNDETHSAWTARRSSTESIITHTLRELCGKARPGGGRHRQGDGARLVDVDTLSRMNVITTLKLAGGSSGTVVGEKAFAVHLKSARFSERADPIFQILTILL